MRALIDLAVSETNTAYDLSGVTTQLRLVHAYREESYVEAAVDAFSQALNEISSTNDNIMDDVHTKRTAYGADIVALIINDSSSCGLAWLGPYYEGMFSVTHHGCATGYYSFGVSYYRRVLNLTCDLQTYVCYHDINTSTKLDTTWDATTTKGQQTNVPPPIVTMDGGECTPCSCLYFIINSFISLL
jgi:hypothetical protein